MAASLRGDEASEDGLLLSSMTCTTARLSSDPHPAAMPCPVHGAAHALVHTQGRGQQSCQATHRVRSQETQGVSSVVLALRVGRGLSGADSQSRSIDRHRRRRHELAVLSRLGVPAQRRGKLPAAPAGFGREVWDLRAGGHQQALLHRIHSILSGATTTAALVYMVAGRSWTEAAEQRGPTSSLFPSLPRTSEACRRSPLRRVRTDSRASMRDRMITSSQLGNSSFRVTPA